MLKKMLLSGCSLDAFLRKPYFSCRSLLLSTSVLNDNMLACIFVVSVMIPKNERQVDGHSILKEH